MGREVGTGRGKECKRKRAKRNGRKRKLEGTVGGYRIWDLGPFDRILNTPLYMLDVMFLVENFGT